jgi:NADH-quinone oxidoreductase subunit M
MLNPLLVILLAPAITVFVLFFVKSEHKQAVRFLAWLGTLISLAAAIYVFVAFKHAPVSESVGDHGYKFVLSANWVPALHLQFKLGVDGMNVALLLLTAFTIFTGVMVSFTIQHRVKEYYISLLALVTGVFGVFSAQDLFFYYFFYELAVIPMFLLIGIWGSTTRTVDRQYATMTLVMLLSTGAVLALVGLIATYTQAGTFDMVALEQASVDGVFSTQFQMVWFPVLFIGFAALVPMWPLHSWSPAGHAAAPAAVSMLHAGVLMKLGAYSIMRIACTYFPEAATAYLPIVLGLCCLNIIYGGLVAVWQKDLKLMVGYSSSSHMGYVLLGIASLTPMGWDGAVFLMVAHGLMTALTFALIGWFYDQTHTRMVGDLGGLMRIMPFAGTCFVIAAMASVGLPGFANFVSEMMVIFGAWEHAWGGGWLLFVPAVLAVWGLVITGVYLLRAIKNVWYGDMPERWKDLRDARSLTERAPYVVLVAVLLFFGFFPQTMIDVIHQGTTPLLRRMPGQESEAAAVENPGDSLETLPGHGAR